LTAAQVLMLTLTFPIMSLLLFLVVQVEKRQFGGGQGGTVSPPGAGDRPFGAARVRRRQGRGRHARVLPGRAARGRAQR
jgi:hypothetical protein